MNKIRALKENLGNFDKFCSLGSESKGEVDWWINNVGSAWKSITISPPDLVMEADASKIGWGCIFRGETANGRWTDEEARYHINVLELKAIQFGLFSFFKDKKALHIRIKSDNTTAIAYLNNMGGVKSKECFVVCKEIWTWAITRDLFLSAEHIPGSKNVLADKASRIFDKNTEWSLKGSYFEEINNKFGRFEIDLFASHLNKKLDVYCAWKPDPFASFIDAFSGNWAQFHFYAFPPFSLILQCLGKISREEASGVVLVPLWLTQPWFPKLVRMLTTAPLVLPLEVLELVFKKDSKHPLHKKLRMVACPVSGKDVRCKAFQNGPLISCVPLGQKAPRVNINIILKDGIFSVLGRKLIPCQLAQKKF